MTWDNIVIVIGIAVFVGFLIGIATGYAQGYKEGHKDRVKMIKGDFTFLEGNDKVSGTPCLKGRGL